MKLKESNDVQFGVHSYTSGSIIFRGSEQECADYINDNGIEREAEIYRIEPGDPHYRYPEADGDIGYMLFTRSMFGDPTDRYLFPRKRYWSLQQAQVEARKFSRDNASHMITGIIEIDMFSDEPTGNYWELKRGEFRALQEGFIVAYDEDSIEEQIRILNKNIEDYQQLIIDEPEDTEYWNDQIAKCQAEIDELKGYQPLDEDASSLWEGPYDRFEELIDYYGMFEIDKIQQAVEELYAEHKGDPAWDEAYRRWNINNGQEEEIPSASAKPLFVIRDGQGNQLSAPNSDDEELWDRVASMEARGKRNLRVVVYTESVENTPTEDQGDSMKIVEAKNNNLNEASYGGAYDIADDQYFTRDDLNEAAEAVVEFICNKLGNDFELGGTWFEDGQWIVNVQDHSYGEYEVTVPVDMRKIKNPKSLSKSYATLVAKQLINQIEEYNKEESFKKDDGKVLTEYRQDPLKAAILEAIDYFQHFEDLYKFPKGKFLSHNWEDLADGVEFGVDEPIEVAEGIMEFLQQEVDFTNKHPEICEEDPQSDMTLEVYNKLKTAYDAQVGSSMEEGWTPPENWVSYKGAWIYPVEGGYEANFTGEHFEAPTIEELKAKLQAARVHRQKFSGYSERDAKFADNIKKFGRELEEKLTGYKITVKKDGKTFDDYMSAYEEEGAIRQMKNKYGKDIEIVKIDDSRVIKEANQLLPIEELNPDGTPKQYDVKFMELEKVPGLLNWDVADQLEQHFRDNKLWVDELHYNQVKDCIEYDINWGDWKHEHLRSKWLLEDLFEKLGIVAHINSHTTEEDGSDTYSAHYIVRAMGKMNEAIEPPTGDDPDLSAIPQIGQEVMYRGRRTTIIDYEQDPEYGYDFLIKNPFWNGQDERFENIWVGDQIDFIDWGPNDIGLQPPG